MCKEVGVIFCSKSIISLLQIMRQDIEMNEILPERFHPQT